MIGDILRTAYFDALVNGFAFALTFAGVNLAIGSWIAVDAYARGRRDGLAIATLKPERIEDEL
jgi:hypothetical protein